MEEKHQKAERQKRREEKRKQRQLMKLKDKETREMNMKIAIEERKLLIAQRKLESIRLLDELFERVKVCRLLDFKTHLKHTISNPQLEYHVYNMKIIQF